MRYADPPSANNNTETKMLHGVYILCVAAQHFFQQTARHVDDSNLRYKFLDLAILHGNAARQLPAPPNIKAQDIAHSELAAVQFWYLHQQAALHNDAPQQTMLSELAGLLQQQLNVLKQLTKEMRGNAARITLAHLSAALQMAIDQLLPLLKVLPANGQKIQTP